MNDIIQNLEANITNGDDNFCMISEVKLDAIKELSKREYQEYQKLKKQLKIKHDGFMASIEEKCELAKENEKLKKQLEEINNFINKANFANIEQLMLDYCAKTEEQKEFIVWLENEIQSCELTCDLIFNHNKEMKIYKIILLKYKEIIGDKE